MLVSWAKGIGKLEITIWSFGSGIRAYLGIKDRNKGFHRSIVLIQLDD